MDIQKSVAAVAGLTLPFSSFSSLLSSFVPFSSTLCSYSPLSFSSLLFCITNLPAEISHLIKPSYCDTDMCRYVHSYQHIDIKTNTHTHIHTHEHTHTYTHTHTLTHIHTHTHTGIKSSIAENGQEAVDIVMLRGHLFDIIFMDHTMPIMVRTFTSTHARTHYVNITCTMHCH